MGPDLSVPKGALKVLRVGLSSNSGSSRRLGSVKRVKGFSLRVRRVWNRSRKLSFTMLSALTLTLILYDVFLEFRSDLGVVVLFGLFVLCSV